MRFPRTSERSSPGLWLGWATGAVVGYCAGRRFHRQRLLPQAKGGDGIPQERPFDKRVFDLASFAEALDGLLDHTDDLRAAARGGRVDKAFAERIMLAVSQVNQCRYCSFAHTRAALRAGVTEEEIRHLTAGDLQRFPQEQQVALLFAQHYAETEGHPDPEAWHRVIDLYGTETARDIQSYARLMMFANLWANTLDALLSRLTGRPAPGSSLGQELGVLLGSLVLIPAGLIRRLLPRKRRFLRSDRPTSSPTA